MLQELPKRDAKIEADIKKKIEQGKKFVQEHAQDVVLT